MKNGKVPKHQQRGRQSISFYLLSERENRTSAPSQDRRREAPHVAAAGAGLAGEPIGLSFSNRLERALLSTSRRGSFIFLPVI